MPFVINDALSVCMGCGNPSDECTCNQQREETMTRKMRFGARASEYADVQTPERVPNYLGANRRGGSTGPISSRFGARPAEYAQVPKPQAVGNRATTPVSSRFGARANEYAEVE